MDIDRKHFIQELETYVQEILAQESHEAEYVSSSVRIVDARNAIFVQAGCRPTAEDEDIYAIRDLVRTDEATLQTAVNTRRIEAIAHYYFD